VLADEVAAEKLGENAVNDVCNSLTQRLHSGANVADAIAETIGSVGQKLALVLPRQAGDVNELPDELVTID
jgi:uncharacterized membrane protein